LLGFKFRRQVSIGRFVVDFACVDRALVLEIDGGQHAGREAEDAARTAWLEARGRRVLRFWNNDVNENIDGVLQRIADELGAAAGSPHSGPLPQAGEGVVDRS
jgi:very-short-patch-repair endonuclease